MTSMYEISPHGIFFPLLIALHDMPQSLESVSMGLCMYTKVAVHVHPKKVVWLSNYL